VVVTDIDGVVKLVPEDSEDPPVAAVYQLIVPADETALRRTVPELQTEPGVVFVIVGVVLTVAVIAVLEPVVQLLAVAST